MRCSFSFQRNTPLIVPYLSIHNVKIKTNLFLSSFKIYKFKKRPTFKTLKNESDNYHNTPCVLSCNRSSNLFPLRNSIRELSSLDPIVKQPVRSNFCFPLMRSDTEGEGRWIRED